MFALLFSLLVVAVGAELLVRGASSLARRAGVSPLFIGLTVVGFGTSMPELGASLAATLAGSPDVAVGNVVGSNIFNVAVILGLTALLRPIRIRLALLRRDLVVAVAVAFVPWLALLTGGVLPRWLGLTLLAVLGVYVFSAYRTGRRTATAQQELAREGVLSATALRPDAVKTRERTWIQVLLVLLGLSLLVGGSRVFVAAAIDVAKLLGISELVIGLTIVAAGTSLPEVVTSIVAAVRRSPDIAVGNVLGSNIFNILGILGASAVASPQAVNPQILARDAPVMLAATLALAPMLRSGGVVSRGEGAVLLFAYLIYLAAMSTAG